MGGVNPHLLMRPFVHREAVLSSQIEGTHATLSDLFLFEQAEAIEKQVPDVREVANYVRALEYGVERLKVHPLGLGLIRELHQVLMTGVRGGERTAGAFRQIRVFIGATHRIEEARYVPPPPLLVQPAMEALERYLQAPSDLAPLVRLAIVHYQFEAIHPFEDGNGRFGRLLITLMLCAERLLPMPMLYLSAFFERHRPEYYRRLLEVSQRGAWGEWIGFFLRGVETEAKDAVDRAAKLMELRREYHARLQTARAPALALKLVDALFSNPAMTMRGVSEVLGITPAAAQKHIDRLLGMGLLSEVTGQRRNRVYLARGIVAGLNDEGPGAEPAP